MTASPGHQLGIDIGGSCIKAVLLHGDAGVVREHVSAEYDNPELEALREHLIASVDVVSTGHAIGGVGVCVAGVLDEQGVVTSASNLTSLIGCDVSSWAREALSLPAGPAVMTDTMAAAQAEHAVRPVGGRVLYLSIGTGVGGVVLDTGEPLMITRNTPGHLGHIDVSGDQADPPRDRNGAIGTLEAYLATDRFEAALIRALRSYLVIYRPDAIVLLGGRGLALQSRLDVLRAKVIDGLSPAAPHRWELRCGVVGRMAGAIGAAMSASGIQTDGLPDRAGLLTEQRNPRSTGLGSMGIREIVDLIQQEDATIAPAVDRAKDALAAFVEAAEPGFCGDGRLIYLGAGTSGRLGVLDASEMPPTFQSDPGKVVGIIAGGDRSLRRSSEGKEDNPRGARTALDLLELTERDSVLGIAAGGTTPYVLGGLAHAQSIAPGINTGLLCCTPIDRPSGVDHLIVVATGPEVVTGSTRMKAGTATKLVLNTISTALMVRAGRVHENLMVDLRATNAKLRDRAARIIATLTGLARDEAFALLDGSGGEVKTAIVMHHRQVSAVEARRLIHEAGGRIADVLRDG